MVRSFNHKRTRITTVFLNSYFVLMITDLYFYSNVISVNMRAQVVKSWNAREIKGQKVGTLFKTE